MDVDIPFVWMIYDWHCKASLSKLYVDLQGTKHYSIKINSSRLFTLSCIYLE